MARKRLDAVKGVDRRVAVGKDVEEVLGTDRKPVGANPVRPLNVRQPFRGVLLVISRIEGEAAEGAIAQRVDVQTEAGRRPVAADTQAVVWLSSFDAPTLDAIEEHRGVGLELRGRGD